MLKSDRPTDQQALMDKFNGITLFASLPEEGDQRASAENGKAVIEFSRGKTTLFVQTLNLAPKDLACGATLLHVFLDEYLPTWQNRGRWLDACLAERHEETKMTRRNEGVITTLRVTMVGVFLEIANA